MSVRNTVLVGIGSTEDNGDEHALQRAYALAHERDLSVTVIHAVDLPTSLFKQVDPEALAKARASALDRLAPSVVELGGRAALERDLRVVAGPAGRALLEQVEEQDAARIVVGAHHKEGLTDLFGNTTRTLVTRAECPVWIQKGPVRHVKKILAAVDLAPEGPQTIALAREEAAAFGAELELVHVFELPELGTAFGYRVPLPLSVVFQARETAQREFGELLADFEWDDVVNKHTFLDGTPAQELVERARDVDLVVIGTHGGGGFSRTVIGSVATQVIRESETPVLVCRLPHADWTD